MRYQFKTKEDRFHAFLSFLQTGSLLTSENNGQNCMSQMIYICVCRSYSGDMFLLSGRVLVHKSVGTIDCIHVMYLYKLELNVIGIAQSRNSKQLTPLRSKPIRERRPYLLKSDDGVLYVKFGWNYECWDVCLQEHI